MTEPRRRADHPFKDLFDIDALRVELGGIARQVLDKGQPGREIELRAQWARRLKTAYQHGHKTAERWLMAEGSGRRCAERLSRLQDEIISLVHELAVKHLYPSDNPSTSERMAIVAVGGYGRGLMAPGSDTDILFLLPYKQTAWGESVAEAILYVLWDMGLKVGHATRSVDECIRQARGDMTIRTALLEARLLIGDKKLFGEMTARFDTEIVQGTAVEFVAAKLNEREERLKRAGQARYVVEPNVKDGKGGLRDLHTLFWIAKYVYRVHETRELVAKGVFTAEEAKVFRRCEDFLWSVRCHLHFLTGKAEERLSFDLQREMAERLGYLAHPGLKDVERFMKHYFLVAKDVGDLTAIVSAALEERHDKPVPRLDRMIARLRRSGRRTLKESADFIVDNDRINVADASAFGRDPLNLIRIFHLAGKHGLNFHPDAMRLAARSLKLIDHTLRDSAEANRLFIEILCSRESPEIVLRRMNETGVLGRFIPEFGRIVAMMQFNMYHSYTVDEHLIRSIGALSRIERGDRPDYGLANELMPQIKNRQLLYIAVFLHDIAKGRPEDHSIAGARVARRLCPRFGLNAVDTDTVAWLIEQHLTMSTIAQSRDLSDRKTIENFAAVVQNLERMKLLLILTTADIRAVGPGVWNNWKSQLLRTLYHETEPVITGGFSESNRNLRVARAQAEFRAAMAEWDAETLDAYAGRHYPTYWLQTDRIHQTEHARFIRETEARGKALATRAKTDPKRGITELTVFAPDHPKLLAVIAGACASAGAHIVDAQISTTTDGRALDTISLTRAFEHDEDEMRRADRIAAAIEKSLSGEIRLPEVVARRIPRRPRAFTVEPEVTLNNSWSNRHTVIEVSGLDRPGLLYGLTQTLSRLNLNIASAHIATFGERAVDVFYVTDLMGAKIMGAARHSAIRRALLQVLDADDEANAA
ncbi:[protein-PII] uridylyltransferase [Ancylobacter dichloromethanicus]|uniref:Bifunctional uridylyltransferase/uridylyl-removing enzyme n=1 Tax=Ancylobacter dichloromethanicus TaxID=518825 RepID=A0A9W6J7K2_9HYPH|nr:[protein-PII] uridylyltransferase [Ancylobacter dichloromethanicus]MBS7555090.1 [protein-PII] uridylyltransferase [Ancylobacter dichloromethanicus]GLK72300.1 bifunctional uridylyltransferase/uridylyl-removing enzyme [Ancylobacter dichloromethanicus]